MILKTSINVCNVIITNSIITNTYYIIIINYYWEDITGPIQMWHPYII
jgi:hypothetical protein